MLTGKGNTAFLLMFN